ncbi:MAG: transcription termination/antitermination protein NusA [Firmicutes bacterium]|nr:transcription termination/antitermination protein NusA [Bacillota bacterium]
MNLEVMSALNELEKERGITKEIILEAIEAAITSAYKRNYGTSQNVRVEVDEKTGEINVYARKIIVEDAVDETTQIGLNEAKEIDPNYQLDDVIEVEVTPSDFGRIAAQTAKQVVIQRIREAERALIYEEFSNREGDAVTGIVQRWDHRNVIIDLGKVEAVLGPTDQMPGDSHSQGARLKVYISEVRQTSKGPQVCVSRTHPGLVSRLFEMEVPEIYDGTVEIRAVAREAGARSKVAVSSRDQNVDPVGACVGPRGMRVQAVVSELKGEKIDIIPWAALTDEFVANALSPAKVVRVYLDETTKTARAVVPDNHLSLAIGKEGQNARLAARLTGWRIDIKSQEQMAQILAKEAFERATPKDPEDDGLTKPEQADEELDLVAQAETETLEAKEVHELDTVQDEEGETDVAGEHSEVSVEASTVDAPRDVADDEMPIDDESEAELSPHEAKVAGDEDAEDGEMGSEDEDLEEDSDIEELLDEETLRPKRVPKVAAAPGKTRSRKVRKQELESLLEEELIEEEPLPSLFTKDEHQQHAKVSHYVAGLEDDESGFTLAGRLDLDGEKPEEGAKKTSSKGKKDPFTKVVKDFADLRRELGD